VADPIQRLSKSLEDRIKDLEEILAPLQNGEELGQIGQLHPNPDDLIQRKGTAWAARSPRQVLADMNLTKADVGLSLVTNVAPEDLPASTATLIAEAAAAAYAASANESADSAELSLEAIIAAAPATFDFATALAAASVGDPIFFIPAESSLSTIEVWKKTGVGTAVHYATLDIPSKTLLQQFNPLLDTFSYGVRSEALQAGTASQDNGHSANYLIPYNCRLQSIRIKPAAGGTLMLMAKSRVGTTETKLRQYSVTIPNMTSEIVLTQNDFGSNLVWNAGEVFFDYGNGILQFLTRSGPDGGFYATTNGHALDDPYTIGTLSTQFQYQVEYVFERLTVTAAVVKDALARIGVNERQIKTMRKGITKRTIQIGRKDTPVAGAPPGSALTWVWYARIPADGRIKSVSASANAQGPLFSRGWDVDDSTGEMTMAEEQIITLPNGITANNALNLEVKADQRFGFFAETRVNITSEQGNDTGVLTTAGDSKKFTDTSTSALRPQIFYEFEYDDPTLDGYGAQPMPGQDLRPQDRVIPIDNTIYIKGGESIDEGVNQDVDNAGEFLFTSPYGVRMFAMGPRARKGVSAVPDATSKSDSGGTASLVTAAEKKSNSGNSFAFDRLKDSIPRGNTGGVQGLQRFLKLAQRHGIDWNHLKQLYFTSSHSGWRINQYHRDSVWWNIFEENLREMVKRLGENGEYAKCLAVTHRQANNAAQCLVLPGDTYDTVGSLWLDSDEGKAAMEVQTENFIRDQVAAIRNICRQSDGYPQRDQPHFYVPQSSALIQGNSIFEDDFPGHQRRGFFQTMQMRMSCRLPWYHCLGPDFDWPKSSDHLHNLSAGYTYGELIVAYARFEVEILGRMPTCAKPLACYRNGNLVTQLWWSPIELIIDEQYTGIPHMTNYGISLTRNTSWTPEPLKYDPIITNSGFYHPWVRAITCEPVTPCGSDTIYMHNGMHYGRLTSAGGATDEAITNIRLDWEEDDEIVNDGPFTIRRWLPHFSKVARTDLY